MMHFGLQIASTVFMLTIMFNYFRHKRLPLRSTKAFTAFLLVAFLNLLAEWATIHTINNVHLINTYWNRLAHQIFIFSIDAIVFLMFLYVDIKSREQKKYTFIEIIFRIIPLFVTFICILFLDIYYYVGPDGFYSYGPIVYTIFISVPIYVIVMIYELFRHQKAFSNDERITILTGLAIWVIITLIQYFNPRYLLSSLAISLMCNFLFISFENSSKYLFKDIDTIFTKPAFETTVSEFFALKKEFNVVKITVKGVDLSDELLKAYIKSLKKKTNGRFFKYGDNTLCALIASKDDYYNFIAGLSETVDFNLNGQSHLLIITKKGLDSTDYLSLKEFNSALNASDNALIAFQKNLRYKLQYNDIYYVEALEHQTFLYTVDDCFTSKDKLYKLEISLLPYGFIRSSKSMLVNLNKIVSLNNIANSKMVALLTNKEEIIVSRKYMKEFKDKFNNK